MSAARHTSKIRTRVEANEQKVQQPGRIVNALPLLSANGCSANYTQLNYRIPCACKKFLRFPLLNQITPIIPGILDSVSGAYYTVSSIINGVYYFIINSSTNIIIENSTVRNAVIVGPGGNGNSFGESGSAGTIRTLTSAALNNNTGYSIRFDPTFVAIGALRSYYGLTSGLPGVNGQTNSIGRGVGGNAGLIYFLPVTYINGYSGLGYGAGGGGQTNASIVGGGGEGGFNPDLYFGVNGLNTGMPTSTITTNGSPGVVIFALS